MLLIRLILPAMLVLASAVATAADLPAAVRQAIDAHFADYTAPGSPGVAIAIHRHGEPIHAAGYGLADLEAASPITPSTPFHVASVSKQFTAFAIALLVREGRVDLDANIRTYLPYVPDFGHVIRVRHLIAHTSGLRNQWTLFAMGGQELGNRLRQRQIVQLVSRQQALDFVPGAEYAYSNTGYTLLAEIVRSVTGQSLRAFTTARMFTPHAMPRTFFFDDVTEVVPGRANSYVRQGDRWTRSLLNFDNVGATGLFSTVEDLATWGSYLLAPPADDKTLVETVTTPARLDNGAPLTYAYALERIRLGGRDVIMHSGSDAGFNALFVLYPEAGLVIVTAANTPMNLREKTAAIADLLLPRGTTEGNSAPDASAVPPARPTRPAALPNPPAHLLARYVGDYRSAELDHTYSIRVDNGQLVLDALWNAAPVPLDYVGGQSFASPLWYLGRLTFDGPPDQPYRTMHVDGGRARHVRFDRLGD